MHVDFVDQTLRDGQQSLWGIRMQAHEAADALPHLARAGYKTIDLTGAGMFTVLLREFAVDPWATLDFMVAGLGNNQIRSGLRTISAVGFAPTPQAILDLWIATLIKHGSTSFWLYDCLFDLDAMKHMVDVVRNAGGQPVPAVMYGLTDVHDDAYFASRAGQMASWAGVESIYIEDAAGVLKPERAKTLLPAIRAATGTMPLEMHAHNTTGLAEHNYIVALQSGFQRLHTASRPLANGASLPSTESMVNIVEYLGMTHSLDTSTFAPVAESCVAAATAGGHLLGIPAEYDPRVYDHQLPGGMTGTLINQLAAARMSHRLPEVLAAIPQVRVDLGSPIMATPFSQFVGIQAVLNIITGDPYSMVPDEVIHYALGHYGPVPAPINPHAAARMSHRLPEVLAAIPQVRIDLGSPIMATPFSQFVGIQAVLNIITGDPYSMVPDEVIHYALGHYGPVPAPINPQVLDRILGSARAKQFESWVRPDPSIEEIRKNFSRGISDEELLIRYMMSDEEVDRMIAKGPIRTDPRRSANNIVGDVTDLIAESKNSTSFNVSTPDFTVKLKRKVTA